MLISKIRPLLPRGRLQFSTAFAARKQIMQNTNDEWKKMTKTSGRVYFGDYEYAAKLVESLGYGDFYKNGSIADLYPGNCVFSAALYNTLQPKKYCMFDPSKSYFDVANHLSEGLDGVSAVPQDPFRWDVLRSAIEDETLKVETQPWDQVNDSLLLFANLTNSQSKQLIAQYLSVIGRRSWIFKHGRIRLLVLLDTTVAERLMADEGSLQRTRLSATREFYTDSRVIFWEPKSVDKKAGKKTDKKTSKKNDKKTRQNSLPAVFNDNLIPEVSTWFAPVGSRTHKTKKVTLIELTPKNVVVENVEVFEHVIKQLMITSQLPAHKGLESLGPGALDGMGPALTDILDIQPRDFTPEHWQRVTNAFQMWPFRPDHTMDFYEDDYSSSNTKVNAQISGSLASNRSGEEDLHEEYELDETMAHSA